MPPWKRVDFRGREMAFAEAMAAVQKHIRAADTLAAIGAGLSASFVEIASTTTLLADFNLERDGGVPVGNFPNLGI